MSSGISRISLSTTADSSRRSVSFFSFSSAKTGMASKNARAERNHFVLMNPPFGDSRVASAWKFYASEVRRTTAGIKQQKVASSRQTRMSLLMVFAGFLCALFQENSGYVHDRAAFLRDLCEYSPRPLRFKNFDFFAFIASLLRSLRLKAFSPPPQKLNVACSSSLRIAAWLENGPPASATDRPKLGEATTPIGAARFSRLSTLRAFTLKVRL